VIAQAKLAALLPPAGASVHILNITNAWDRVTGTLVSTTLSLSSQGRDVTRVFIRRKQNTRARVARQSSARLLLTFLTLFAFTCQSYLTQTHIHIWLASGTEAPLAADSGTKSLPGSTAPKDKFPANQDPANCPICQEIVHAGPAIVPVAAAVVLSALPTLGLVIVAETARHFNAPSHNWQGRAPPQD
jgi:hypothetical protein